MAQKKELLGTKEVDKLIKGLQIGAQWAVEQDAKASADREGWGDDAYRLLKGGVRNTLWGLNEITDYAKGTSEGRLDDYSGGIVSGLGHVIRLGEYASKVAGDTGGAIAEHGLGIDPRIGQVAGSIVPELLVGKGLGIAKKAGLLNKIDNIVPRLNVPGPKLSLAGVKNAAKKGAKKSADDLLNSKPLQHAAGSSPYANKPLSDPLAPGEGSAASRVFKREVNNVPQDSIRSLRAQNSTHYGLSDPDLFNKNSWLATAISGEPHHVADHALIGAVNEVLDLDQVERLFRNLDREYGIRVGNDAFQMINIPGTKKFGKGGRADHVSLLHMRYYPQITSRNMLLEYVNHPQKRFQLKEMHDDRIAALVASTVHTQQQITIGWAKWKLDQVRSLYPETFNLKPKAMRKWLEKHPEQFAKAGGKSAPERYEDIMKYGAMNGQTNYSNEYLRQVFNVEYAKKGAGVTEALIPLKHAARLEAMQQISSIRLD